MPGIDPAPGGEEEAGLQNERTALAWRRTALACVAAGAFVARRIGGSAGLAVLAASLLCGGAISVEVERRYRQRAAALVQAAPVVAHGDVAALTGAVLALSAAALVAVAVT